MCDAITPFEQLLGLYWLRPETALWRGLDIEAMKGFDFSSPSLDLGCGDGVFSFVRAGGGFDLSFDVFQSVTKLGSFFDDVDVFDNYDKIISPLITKKCAYQIDYAFDHKENLLKKAKTLGFYKNFVLGDANNKLPFKDNFFKSVFSNIVYWLDAPERAFLEIARILRPGGRCCVMLPNITFPDFSFYFSLYVKQRKAKFKFLEKLDRGRVSNHIKHAKMGDEWLAMTDKAGLEVVSHKMHLSKTVIQIWDVGLRPLFPLLYKMASEIDNHKALEIKKEWTETFKMFLTPILEADGELNPGEEPAFHCLILQKRG